MSGESEVGRNGEGYLECRVCEEDISDGEYSARVKILGKRGEMVGWVVTSVMGGKLARRRTSG